MDESRRVKKYYKNIVIGCIVLLLFAFFAWIFLVKNEPEIELVSIRIISDHDMIGNVYELNVGDEVEIEITVKNQTNLSIRYLEINQQKFREKDIHYDLSYMEPDNIDDGTRKLSIIYIVQEDDEFIRIKEVRLYVRGFLYLGQKLDTRGFDRFEISIE